MAYIKLIIEAEDDTKPEVVWYPHERCTFLLDKDYKRVGVMIGGDDDHVYVSDSHTLNNIDSLFSRLHETGIMAFVVKARASVKVPDSPGVVAELLQAMMRGPGSKRS